jgi:gliding motility-associated-like protein
MVFVPLESSATHIIGGEINYSCLGNDQYEITLQLFRDCDTGVPWFEDPATIQVYDDNGTLVDVIEMYLNPMDNDTLTFASSGCSIMSSSACIHTTTYRKTKYLPFLAGGYDLVYQICCRNVDIVNIIDPTDARAAYHSYISETALLTCNHGAKFNSWPAFYVCAGQPMNFDHSAIDLDGDSIAYELYTPFDTYDSIGAGYVDWIAPFNLNNMMGLPLPFAINPITGLLTGTPFINGTFVVGICAKEYRNGYLISITRRDFQFVVTACASLIAANFETNIPNCSASFDVPFNNLSQPPNGPFVWDFGDNSSLSSLPNPIHSYQDTGFYTVMLIAAEGYPCVDTIFKEIHLVVNVADIELEADSAVCKEGKILVVARNIFSNYNEITNYSWFPASSILSGQGTDSVWVSVTGGSYSLIVVAENNFGCTDQEQITRINIPIDLVEAAFDSLVFFCNRSLKIPFTNRSTAANDQFLWTFDNLGTSTEVDPSYTFPDTGAYTIRLIAGVGQSCQDTVFKEIYIPQSGVDIMTSDSQVTCSGDTLLLVATDLLQGFDIVDYSWSPVSDILSGQGTDSVWVLANADVYYTIVATNTEHCKDTSYSDINVSSISPIVTLTANPNQIYLGQQSQLLTHYDFDYTYKWTFEPTLNDSTVHNPIATPRISTTYQLQVTSPSGCQIVDTVRVRILAPVCDNPVVFVPNAFTPDDDGHNDILMVNGNNVVEMTMMIYNRWGQKVFETNDQNIGWDGTFKGKLLPPDVYGYYMKCTCDKGGQLLLKGSISLLR